MYNQREIVLIPFPYSDLTGAKQRPALILSNSMINKNDDCICCLITSNPYNKGLIINKDSFEAGKLPFKSWVKPHRIFTINQKIIRKKLCKININFHEKIIHEILKYFRSEFEE